VETGWRAHQLQPAMRVDELHPSWVNGGGGGGSAGRGGGAATIGAASVASFLAAILTEMYLCNVCSCQEILRRNGRG
jgi:hypothetical protein